MKRYITICCMDEIYKEKIISYIMNITYSDAVYFSSGKRPDDKLGDILKEELSDYNALRKEDGTFEKEYHLYVETMLRLAEEFYYEKKYLTTESDKKHIITDFNIVLTKAYLMAVCEKSRADSISYIEWLKDIIDFGILPNLIIYVNSDSFLKLNYTDKLINISECEVIELDMDDKNFKKLDSIIY